jgi:transposase
MMGYQTARQEKLCYSQISLEQRVRANHPRRRIARGIDFEFVYAEVADRYGTKGNVSVPPPVILKLLLLLVLYNVRSERELMETIPERLDWLWFLGYDLDAEIPNHSVLSKARRRWGPEVFQRFFERIVWQCVEAGLVDGSKIFVDASLVEANAANNSVVDTQSLKRYLNERYKQLEARLEDVGGSAGTESGYRKVNTRYVSTTDPEAAIVRRGKPKLYYAIHRTVDARSEIITATEVTAGDVNEAHRLLPLVDSHHHNTHRCATTVVADSKYGTVENFLACYDRGLHAHLPDLGEAAAKRSVKRKLFPEAAFPYDPSTDTYHCPAGQLLKPKSLHANRQSLDYAAPKKVCAACPLRARCTQNKSGRTLKRHLRQTALDMMRQRSRGAAAKRDIHMRQHLMERSFARAKRYGFDRARWRGVWRVRIQEYVTCAIQNLVVLLRYGGGPTHKAAAVVQQVGKGTARSGFERSAVPLPLLSGLAVLDARESICSAITARIYLGNSPARPDPSFRHASRHSTRYSSRRGFASIK